MTGTSVGLRLKRRGPGSASSWLALLTALPLMAIGQSSLPPEVQADIVKARIVEAGKRNDLKGVLAGVDEIDALKVPVAPSLRFLEARAAQHLGDSGRALKALEQFLATTERSGPAYAEAVQLYPRYQAAAESAKKEQAERKRRELRANAPIEVANLIDSLPAQMLAVPAGTFMMGGQGSGDIPADEKPVHLVALKGFRLGKYEVTFDQYDVFAKATGRPLPSDADGGRGSRPVINVSWEDARAYAAWLSELSGERYRLPSEAEWEYAARAGTTTAYPWGEAFSVDQANGQGTAGRDTFENTAPVGSFPPNAWGLHDMIGNVWEWTEDCWNASYAGAPADGSAWTSGDCSRRVVRGGSWGDDPALLRVSFRAWNVPAVRYGGLGFRLAQDP